MSELTRAEFDALSPQEQFNFLWEREVAAAAAEIERTRRKRLKMPHTHHIPHRPRFCGSEFDFCGYPDCGMMYEHSVPDNVFDIAVRYNDATDTVEIALNTFRRERNET